MANAIINLLDEKQAHALAFLSLNLKEKECIKEEKKLLLEGKCVRKIRKTINEVGDKILHASYVKF
tara:strand:+ start:111 stop:308 length:198 start_codon:yes stop_codon:yes gene_type:complete